MTSKSYYGKVFVWCLIATTSSGVITYIYTQDQKQITLVSMTEFVATMSLYSLFEYYWPSNIRNSSIHT